MIIHLHKSTLFTQDPDVRFAKEYRLPKGLWTEMWKRYQLWSYQPSELQEYYYIKTGRHITISSISRWLWRSRIYSQVRPLMKKGVQTVVSDFFGDNEMLVVKELLKNIKTSVSNDSKILP